VAAATHANQKLSFTSKADRIDNIAGRPAPSDHRRTPLDHAIPDTTCSFEILVIGG
jgi:hypothetical protein